VATAALAQGPDCGDGRKPNRLVHESSPYLLQHAYNSVYWYPWGDEAFARAAREDKLVFLSIGYSTCHWCHVMERESFESEEIAAVLNERYVSVKVDREERPDVDAIYMTAVQAIQGHGGWPLTVFVAPDRRPVWGTTYLPPEARGGTAQRGQAQTDAGQAPARPAAGSLGATQARAIIDDRQVQGRTGNPSQDADAAAHRTSGDAVPDGPVDGVDEIVVHLGGPFLVAGVDELLAEAGRAAEVHAQHRVAAVGEELVRSVQAPRVAAPRPAVYVED
jgi:hypothetical protein